MDPPNIVWITIDSIRQDHTTMAGYRCDTTPNLQEIASMEDGASFSRCFAHARWTAASSASILTGTNPMRHNVGVDEWRLDEMRQVPNQLETVAERLQAHGYQTGCLSNNSHVSPATGLTRGFDRHEVLSPDAYASLKGVKSLVRFLAAFRQHSSEYTLDYSSYNHTVALDTWARGWLDDFTDTGGPFFLYLHNNDPHHPYTPPISYRDRFTDGLSMDIDEILELCWRFNDNIFEYCEGKRSLDDEELAAIEAMYDATLAYIDDWLGELFEYVQSTASGPTIFVVTADHGELFGERNLFGHNFVLDDAVLHVPFVVHGLDGIEERTDDIVQHIDLMRTILETTGADTDGMQGVDLRHGNREFAVAHRGSRDRLRESDFDHVPTPPHPDGVTCFRTSEFKYELGNDGGAALFRLPDEETDVSDQYPEKLEEFEEIAETWLEAEGSPATSDQESAEYTDAMKERLKAMGYL